MSLKRDFKRLGAAFDSLTPGQRTRIVGGLVQFSELLHQVRPMLREIGDSIAGALPPDDAKRLGGALKDTMVSVILGFARRALGGGADHAIGVTMASVADAVEALPVSTSDTFRPLLAPWEA